MARLSNDSVSLSNFIDETLPLYNNNLQMEELDTSAESRVSDPLSLETPACNDGSKKTKFEKNSLVFAKLSGHSDPPWPATVVNLCWNNGTHCGYEVFFYGTYQVGKVLANKVWKYNEASVAKFSKAKIASLRKRTDFYRGLVEIRDCPDIAPSRDVPESASEIAKKLIRTTTNEDHLKLQAPSQTNDVNTEKLSTCNPPRKKAKMSEIGTNLESSSVMRGIGKVGGKLKPSSWILEKSDKRPMQDKITFEDDNYEERSCISEPSISYVRRSTRTIKQPYWRRVEAKTNEMAARQIDELSGGKSKGSYRKKTPSVNSKIQGVSKAGNKKVKISGQKSHEKETKNTSVDCPSMSRSKNDSDDQYTRAQLFTTPSNSTSSMEMPPRPQKRSWGEENQQERLPDTDTDSTGTEQHPVVRRALKRNMKPGAKRDCLIVKEEPASEDPRDWTVAQTVSAIIRTDPSIAPEDIKAIRDHKIDGKALLKLSVTNLVTLGQMKLGPAIKLTCMAESWIAKSQEFQ